MKLILASSSPRRQKMLKDLDLDFEVISPEIDETRLRGEPAVHYVQRLARKKAERAAEVYFKKKPEANSSDWCILAADTSVILGTSVLGKPENADDALKMLKKLSGRSHEVVTGFAWMGSVASQVQVQAAKKIFSVHRVRTLVTFAKMDEDFWKWYISTGEPMDKAGAYGAQDIGKTFIEKVSGSYSNVIGLPLAQVMAAFKKNFGGDMIESCKTAR